MSAYIWWIILGMIGVGFATLVVWDAILDARIINGSYDSDKTT